MGEWQGNMMKIIIIMVYTAEIVDGNFIYFDDETLFGNDNTPKWTTLCIQSVYSLQAIGGLDLVLHVYPNVV